MTHLYIILICGALLLGCAGQPDTFQEIVKQLDETEQEIRARQEEMQDMIRTFNASQPEGNRIDTTDVAMVGLSVEQTEALNRMLANEEDISFRGLLAEIVETRQQVDMLQEQVRRLLNRLPAPYTVQEGDSHYEVAMRYLMGNHDLAFDKAHSIVENTALLDELEVGFQIWMLYEDEVFGTYVTQGTAAISPGKAQRRARDEALARIKASEQQRRMLETRLRSILYDVDTMEAWKKKNVIKDPIFGGPRIISMTNVAFSQSHDLGVSNTMIFEARSFPDLKQIKRVDIFPRSFIEDQDYRITFENKGVSATITILKPDIFAGQRVVVALR